MTSAAAIRPGAGERWLGATAPIVRVSRPMAIIAGASLLGHLAMVGSIGVTGRTAVTPPTEIAACGAGVAQARADQVRARQAGTGKVGDHEAGNRQAGNH